MAEHAYQLVVRKGPKPGQLFPLNLETMIIGRDPTSDIPIDDVEVSRRHARLIETPEGYQIQDMGSTNGTFVDGKRLGGEPQLLLPGQLIILGSNVNLVYQMVTEPDAFATVVAPLAMEPEEPAVEAGDEEEALERAGEAVELPVLPEPPTAVQEPATEEPVEIEPIEEEHFEIEPIGEQAIVELEAEEELEAIEEEVPTAPPAEPPAEVAAIASLFEEGGEAEPEPMPEEEEEALATIMEAPFPPPAEEALLPELEEEVPPLPPAEPETVTPFPSFAQAEGQEVVDSGGPIAELEREEVMMAPPPPPPPPRPPKPQGDNRNRTLIIIAVAAIILLCCCVTAVVLIILFFVPTSVTTSAAPIGAALAALLAGSLP